METIHSMASLSIHQLMDTLVVFIFLAIVNNAAMNIDVHVFSELVL